MTQVDHRVTKGSALCIMIRTAAYGLAAVRADSTE